MTPGRRLATVVVLDALGAALLLAAAGRTWLTLVEGRPRPLPDVVTTLTGAGLSGARAVGLLALAAVAALPAARGPVRVAVGLVLVTAGAAGLVDVGEVVADPAAAAAAGPGVEVVTGSGWPLVALAGAALVALAGVLVVAWRRSLPGLSARYARRAATAPGTPAAAAPVPRPADPDVALWEALDAGVDPTERSPRDG